MDLTSEPSLRDDDVLLRRWTADDVEIAQALQDAEIARWLDVAPTVPAEWDDSQRTVGFLVEWRGDLVGHVQLRRREDAVGELFWVVYEPFRGLGLATRAVRLLVEHGFHDLGLARVEARVSPLNRASLRVALRSGLRREGLLRGNAVVGGERQDTVVLGRLRDDPSPSTRHGFTAMLDSTLPVKRAIAQGVLRNERGEVLLCELAYKREWDLPGGVVDPAESPAACVVREIREELGLEVAVNRLLSVDWLPPWIGWRDAVLFVFDLGTTTSDITSLATLEEREIRDVHWAGPDAWATHVAAYTTRLLDTLEEDRSATGRYLEDGRPVLEDQFDEPFDEPVVDPAQELRHRRDPTS